MSMTYVGPSVCLYNVDRLRSSSVRKKVEIGTRQDTSLSWLYTMPNPTWIVVISSDPEVSKIARSRNPSIRIQRLMHMSRYLGICWVSCWLCLRYRRFYCVNEQLWTFSLWLILLRCIFHRYCSTYWVTVSSSP